jgi:hypothetical protein
MDVKSWSSLAEAIGFIAPVALLVVLLALGATLAYRGVAYADPAGGQDIEVPFARRMALFAMGGVFGATLGCFMGASQDLPASNILNMVVPLISGYIAYLTSRDMAPEVKMFVPGVVSILLLSLLVTFWHMKYYFSP